MTVGVRIINFRNTTKLKEVSAEERQFQMERLSGGEKIIQWKYQADVVLD